MFYLLLLTEDRLLLRLLRREFVVEIDTDDPTIEVRLLLIDLRPRDRLLRRLDADPGRLDTDDGRLTSVS